MKKQFFTFAILIFLQTTQSLQAFQSKEYPELSATTLDGRKFDLSELRGKVVLINFWASWCQYCRKEMIVLNDLYQKYHSRGFEVIGVSVDHKNSRDKALTVGRAVSYSVIMESEAVKNSFDSPAEIPIDYLVGKDGRLYKELTVNESQEAKEEFESLLKQLLAN